MDAKFGSKVMYIDNDLEEGRMVQLYLEQECNDEVVLCVPDYQQVQTAVERDVPALVILNFVSEPIKQGLQGIFDFYRHIKTTPALQNVPVLLWRVPNPKAMYEEARQLGVSGYIEYVCSLEELGQARDELLKGGTYYPPIASR